MGRILFFLLVVVVAYFAYRSWRIAQIRAQRPPAPPPPGPARVTDSMVRCQACGVHVPRGEALPRGEHFYCSEEHRSGGTAPR